MFLKLMFIVLRNSIWWCTCTMVSQDLVYKGQLRQERDKLSKIISIILRRKTKFISDNYNYLTMHHRNKQKCL